MDLSVLVTSEVDHAGELLGAPPAVLDGLSASAVTVSTPGTSRSRVVTSRTQCRHRTPPTISPIVRIRVSPSRACFVPACDRPLSGGCPLAGEKDDVPAGCVRMRTKSHAGTAARLGGVTSRQKQDRRRTGARWNLQGSAASPRRSTLREGDPCLPPHQPRKGSAAGAGAHRGRAIRGDHGHVDHRRCLRGVVRHHGVSSRAPLTEFLPDPPFIRTSQPSGEDFHVASHS